MTLIWKLAGAGRNRRHRTVLVRGGMLACLALSVLTNCSNIYSVVDNAYTANGNSDYRKLVADEFKNRFSNSASFSAYEISAPRTVHSRLGETSLVCLRFDAQGRRRAYVFFIRNGSVIDSRYDVQTDGCDAQEYAPFDLIKGLEKPANPPALDPLY